jgi:hypothetical protein
MIGSSRFAGERRHQPVQGSTGAAERADHAIFEGPDKQDEKGPRHRLTVVLTHEVE